MTPTDRLLEAIHQLVEPRTHREPYTRHLRGTWITEPWITHVPSLLDQLTRAVPGGNTDSSHTIPDSRPQAHLEALDTLHEIDTESARILNDHGIRQRPTIAANVRALIGITYTEPTLHRTAHTAWAWRTRAAVITGWEVAARKLDNTCPLCAQHGTLRVRVDTSTASGTGFCVNCRQAWDEDHVGLLAAHIKLENGELEEATA